MLDEMLRCWQILDEMLRCPPLDEGGAGFGSALEHLHTSTSCFHRMLLSRSVPLATIPPAKGGVSRKVLRAP